MHIELPDYHPQTRGPDATVPRRLIDGKLYRLVATLPIDHSRDVHMVWADDATATKFYEVETDDQTGADRYPPVGPFNTIRQAISRAVAAGGWGGKL